MSLHQIISALIQQTGPIAFDRFMQLALYHPELGYYASEAQRSGRDGDFYTSVDVGPLFGELLAVQFIEMCGLLGSKPILLVEAGAGNGRLLRDVLDALKTDPSGCYPDIRVWLAERSAVARATHASVLGPHAHLIAGSSPDLPDTFTGLLFANEILDAMPAHLVSMTDAGLHEVVVDVEDGRFVERPGPPAPPELEAYLARAGAQLLPGWRAEVPLAAEAWMRDAARRLTRGFIVLIDYGHEGAQLHSASHATGTVRTFQKHAVDAAARSGPAYLQEPGTRDITLHVNFTAIQRAAEAEGLETIALLDQTYFLLGLGIVDRLTASPAGGLGDLRRRMAAKTLMLPGGLGSTHKVLILGRGVGRPKLESMKFGTRIT